MIRVDYKVNTIAATSHERHSFSNHRQCDFLFNRLFRLTKKHWSPRHWPFVRGNHRWPVDSPHKGPVTWKAFHVMTSSCDLFQDSLTMMNQITVWPLNNIIQNGRRDVEYSMCLHLSFFLKMNFLSEILCAYSFTKRVLMTLRASDFQVLWLGLLGPSDLLI